MQPSSFPSAWRALQIFCGYRIILALSLLLFYKLAPAGTYLGSAYPLLFEVGSIVFFLLSLLALALAVSYRRYFRLQLESQVIIDIFVLVLLMHASGGASTGLGALVAVSTTAASILSAHPAGLFFSVIAAIVVFAEELFAQFTGVREKSALTQVGMLSVAYMATSMMGFYLSRRIIESERRASESIRGLASMEKLNEEIIQYMKTGVLVVQANNRIQLINRAAWIHLGMPESTRYHRLDQVSTPLARQLNLWRRKPSYKPKPFRNTVTGPILQPSFSAIGDNRQNVIIFLEDTSVLEQRAQNLKLASLGRLTASIAHEIRNPLGAISHAAQLMAETEELDQSLTPLLDIIHKNTARVNEIIENIMHLSQRKSAQIKAIHLPSFLSNLIKELTSEGTQLSHADIRLHLQDENIEVYFDATQLTQILTNLIDNAARYSQQKTGKPLVIIMVGYESHSHTVFLDVIDQGEGVSQEILAKLFEPFFTTRRDGTGLGLYLARELCEANRARLDYIPITTGGACFRISFASNLPQFNLSSES